MNPPQLAPYGDQVPFADPGWYRDYSSPYYTASHAEFRDTVRRFVDAELTPNCGDWDKQKKVPREVFRKAYEAGLLPGVVGAPWPTEYAGPGPAGYDAFHELILIDEICRCGSGGVVWGLVEGLQIGLPPVLHFGSAALRSRVAPDCLKGNAIICLCISEPTAGSDVAALRCTAEKDAAGNYVVNGEKKWITNGMFADYFTVAVRTGGPGKDGISFLLLEKSMPGISCRQMDCTGVWASGTAFITFDDVRVPSENLIGAENQGFKYIMYNFNHERWGFIVQANRFARVCLEDAFNYALKRKTFGKRLVDHQVIRWKLAEMARQVESTHAMLETITYQMTRMTKEEQNIKLARDCALIKRPRTPAPPVPVSIPPSAGGAPAAHWGITNNHMSHMQREAAQIMGGNSYIRGGQGERVERLYREVRAYAIPGGSEEILLDLAVKQAMRAVDNKPRAKL